jgi:predicted XRE-type DNA-binding protein
MTKATRSCGNVFADLGLPDAEEMLTKSQLIMAISEILKQRGLTQTQAAAIVGVDQPKISALLRGRTEGFSIERLIRVLAALGYEVVVQVRPAERLRSRQPEQAAEAAA